MIGFFSCVNLVNIKEEFFVDVLARQEQQKMRIKFNELQIVLRIEDVSIFIGFYCHI